MQLGETTRHDDGRCSSGANALIGLLVDEPEIYGFIVRSMRASDRGVLDNPLVRTLHDRVQMLISLLAPDADEAMVSVVTDGMFGFIFAMVESWQMSAGTVPRRGGPHDRAARAAGVRHHQRASCAGRVVAAQ